MIDYPEKTGDNETCWYVKKRVVRVLNPPRLPIPPLRQPPPYCASFTTGKGALQRAARQELYHRPFRVQAQSQETLKIGTKCS